MFDIHAFEAAAYRVMFDGESFRFADSNASCRALLGLFATHQTGLTPHDIFAAPVADDLVSRYRSVLAGGSVSYEASAIVGGRARSWRTTLIAVPTASGGTDIFGICGKLDEEPGARTDAPPGGRDMPSLVLDMLDGGYWTLDMASRDFRTSRRLAEKLAGPGHASLNLAEYVSHIHAEDLTLEMPEGDGDMIVEFRAFTHDGRMLWLRTLRRCVRNATGRTIQVVGIVLDITRDKTALLRFQEEAQTDNLTLIGNRRAFDRAAKRRFGEEPVAGIGLVLIDLDGFKPVNDIHGHQFGDALLREAADRLSRRVAPGDLPARIGGDEFAIIVADATADGLDALVARIESEFAEPFEIAGRSIRVAASCGSALRAPTDRSVGDILARADRALYAAKARRKAEPERLTA